MLKSISYWTDTRFHEMKTIHPKYLVDPQWEVARRPSIVRYLRSGVCVLSQMGFSYCRFEGGPPDREMGSSDLSDGVYVWPEGLAIYVEQYHVRLPDQFISHMADRNFSVPTDLDACAIDRARKGEPTDMKFWTSWCKSERRKLVLKSFWKSVVTRKNSPN
jgi:hypothetical protein